MDEQCGESPKDFDDQVKAKVLQWVRSTTLRLTLLRMAVVRVLEAAADPLSAEAVYRQLGAQGKELSLATTYRILKDLEAAGLLRREMHQDTLGMRSLYSIKLDESRPKICYFECDICKVKRRLPAPALIDQLANAAGHQGFHAQHEMVVIVRCADCTRDAAV